MFIENYYFYINRYVNKEYGIKRSKCDEFYTIYDNIEKIYKSGYMKPTVFKDKIIYCNCEKLAEWGLIRP